MKKSLLLWQILGFVFTGIMGVLLHFLFDWTGGSVFAAPFSAVNESIWEHMKLLFFPMFLFASVESHYLSDHYDSFWCVKQIGILLGILLIPILYYTLGGAFGKTPDYINIAIFFITNAIVYLLEMYLLQNNILSCKSPQGAQRFLLFIGLIFVLLTFFPLRLPLFEDPQTGTFGFFMETFLHLNC